MRMFPRRFLSALLSLFFFLLPCVSLAEILELPIDFSAGMPLQEQFSQTKMEYSDPSIQVTRVREQSKDCRCTYYAACIKVANPTQIRTVSAGGFDSRMKVEVAVMAKRVNAVVAIDGDFYAEHPGSFVLRQGVLYRNSVNPDRDILLIDEAGDFHIILAEEGPGNMDLTQIDGKKVINGFEFGPALIRDGQPVFDYSKSPKNSEPDDRAQRMCICQTGDLEYMVVCVSHWGLTIADFCALIQTLGDVRHAYTLDGGDSSQLAFMGRKVNNTQDKNPRSVPDCIYFASAYSPD